VPRSVIARIAVASLAWIVPSEIVPGGNPVTAVPGDTPTLAPALPLMTVDPVFVTVDPAKIAKFAVDPRFTVASAAKTLTGAMTTAQISIVKYIDDNRNILLVLILIVPSFHLVAFVATLPYLCLNDNIMLSLFDILVNVLYVYLIYI
jgi:hypothetical protein